MCSWCWGYRPEWLKLKSAVQGELQLINVLGGLAPDSDQPMPVDMQQAIEGHWRKIQAMLGTKFNFDFWRVCQPRRDTYKASRAVIVADSHELGEEMIAAVQQAYYLRAMNPSEPEILADLAAELGLNRSLFMQDLVSVQTETELQSQLALSAKLKVNGMPCLVLGHGSKNTIIRHDYQDYRISLAEIQNCLT